MKIVIFVTIMRDLNKSLRFYGLPTNAPPIKHSVNNAAWSDILWQKREINYKRRYIYV